MIRIFFLIRSLERGGAERQSVELVKGLNKGRFAVTVATFYDGGALRSEVAGLENVALFSLHKAARWDVLRFLFRLWRTAREVRPHILHGYMGVANELCLVVGKALGAKVVWGLRSSYMDFSRYDWAARFIFRVGAWLSRWPDLIIVNSHAGKQHHITNGYHNARMIVIPNGIDTNRYRPDAEAGRRMRAVWGIAGDKKAIGLVGRLDPMKDHPTFLRAAALLAKKRPDVQFVCVGEGPKRYASQLQSQGETLGLKNRLVWGGALSDMVAVYNAFDIATSCSSFGEGFSNAVGEAMASGVPCVVTDVGDAAMIVGQTGVVVRAGDPDALVRGWDELLSMSADARGLLGRAARQRIKQMFEVDILVNRTADALEALI
jgi:glycosyltransferase involved in cell wall biosynthesis